MKYKIVYKNPNTQYIPIEAEFDVLELEEVKLQFPVWRPGRYERGDFVKNICGFQVLDANNKILQVKKATKDSWIIKCANTDTITVSYRYFAAVLNAGSCFMDDSQLYVNPVNCLIYIESKQTEPCKLKLSIPVDFEIACGIPFKDNVASFEDYHELVDSPFIASATLEHLQFSCKGVTFHLWFQGAVKLDDKVIPDIKRYTTSQIKKYGSFPVKVYHYLYHILPVPAYHGVEHQHSTVIALGPTYELMHKLYDDFLGVSSHELYHAWNIKALRPIEMAPYNYAAENYSKLGYVAEGVTTYMGDLFLVESGVKKWDWYKSELEKLMQRHFDNFGRFNYSVAESSFDTWLDGYVSGAPNRKVSIYNEGALLSLIVDAKIRTNSNNQTSLHDAMKELYERFALKKKGYSETDFKNVIEEFANEELTHFFQNYYYGTHSFEPILTKALEQLGLRIEMHPNTAQSVNILGIKCSNQPGKITIKVIYPGSSAELAGIMLEDEIVSINGFKLAEDLDKWVAFFKDEQLELQINRMGRLLSITCPHTNKSYFPIYKIKKANAPSNLQKRVFKKWCGADWDES